MKKFSAISRNMRLIFCVVSSLIRWGKAYLAFHHSSCKQLCKVHTVRGLQKKYPREGSSLFSSWGEKVLRKQMKSTFMGRKHLSSYPQIQKVTWDRYAHAFWVPQSPGREIRGCVKPKFLRAAIPPVIASCNLAFQFAFQVGGGGRGVHAQVTHFMRVDVSTSWDHEGQSTGREGLCDFPRNSLFLCVF